MSKNEMNYFDGRKINVGDRIELLDQGYGVVVCSIDDDAYDNEFPKSDWSFLKTGILLKMDNENLIYYPESDCDLIKLNER